jgi:hypothetical protein
MIRLFVGVDRRILFGMNQVVLSKDIASFF